MKKRNILSDYTKIDKKDIVNKEMKLTNLIPLTTEKGDAVVAVFEDDTYTYVPSTDLQWVIDEVLTDDESMNEITTVGFMVTVREHTSKNGRSYYTMF